MAKALAEDWPRTSSTIACPCSTGWGATSRLRAAEFRRPIVALTASAAADSGGLLAAGCNDHLTKPIGALCWSPRSPRSAGA